MTTTTTKTASPVTANRLLDNTIGFNNMEAGDTVQLYFSGSDHDESQLFLGFTDIDGKYEEGTRFANLKSIKQHHQVNTMKDLEAVSGPEYGMSVYALFTDGDITWTAYIYNGGWVYGSGAERLQLIGKWEDHPVLAARKAAKELKEQKKAKRARRQAIEAQMTRLQKELDELSS